MHITKLIRWLAFLLILSLQISFGIAKEADSKSYKVGPGDILHIEIWDHDDLNRDIEISQDGSFTFPFIGSIDASNLSVHEIEKLLTEKLSDGYIVAPQIVVNVAEYNYRKVFLFGEVQRPGTYPLRQNVLLMELISDAGGFTPDRGATCHIVRNKNSNQASTPIALEEAAARDIITIDLNRLTSGHLQDNIELSPGDSIYINSADHVFVTGEVQNPGEIRWVNRMTVLQAISSAGGGTPNAAVNRTIIVRLKDGKEVKIKPNLSDPVLPNDIIKVPESYF
ncbi:MAG: SLBB domain-containing protein [Desulfobacteraceae bacterium]